MNDEIPLMIQLCRAGARNQGAKVIKLFAERLKFGIVVNNRKVTLLEGIKFFLELNNSKELNNYLKRLKYKCYYYSISLIIIVILGYFVQTKKYIKDK